MKKELKVSSPWIHFVNELKVLFANDPEVEVKYFDEDYEVKLYIENEAKADALAKLLPSSVIFGNVALNVTIVPANSKEEDYGEIFKTAFNGNPALDDVLSISALGGTFLFAMFKKDVGQFFDDNISNPKGFKSMIYEDVAKDVLVSRSGVFITTSCEDKEEK